MEFLSNIETVDWVQTDTGVLRLSGWVLAKDGTPIQSIRLRSSNHSATGYYGIQRFDVAKVYPTFPHALFCGFSILTPRKGLVFPCLLEVQDSALTWYRLETLEAAQITRETATAMTSAELEGFLSPVLTASPNTKRPMLFISHDFAFAGAQIILLRLLRWLRANSGIDVEILVATLRSAASHASPGEQSLLSGFAETGPVHFLSDITQAPENLSRIRCGNYRLIYANTGTLGWLLTTLGPFSCPVVTHVHELGFWLEKRTGLEIFARQSVLTDRFIACSTSVRDYLVGRPGIPGHRIEVIHDCGSIARALQALSQHSREEIRRELGIPSAAFVVVACGTFDWRKGADLFTPICVALQRKLGDRDFRGLWIGDYGTDLVREQFVHEAETAGLAGKISLLGQQKEPLRWMLAADCFALPSREDPFPIVMLEAGALGLPVVGFAGSGGVTEFAGQEAGLVVPYLDVEAFADALHRLAENPLLTRSLGAVARARATGKYDETASFQRILALIESLSVAPAPAWRA